MISKPSDKTTKPVQTSASAHGTADGDSRIWESGERERLARLAAELAPGLAPSAAAGRLVALEASATPAQVEAFLRAEIPAARERGASYPFAAALSRWTPPAPTPAPRAAPPLPPAAPPPPVRGSEAVRLVPRLPESQIETNRQGARAALAALRGGAPAPRRGLEKP